MTLHDPELLARRRRFSADEYHRLVEFGVVREDERVELIGGEVLSLHPVSPRQAAVSSRVVELLILGLDRRATVRIGRSLALGPHDEPQPDLVVARRREDFYAAGHPGPDDVVLVIEVGDTSARFDRVVKAPLYARSGVREVWLVDLPADEVRVMRRPGDDGYTDVTVKRRGEALHPVAFPDLALQVDQVLG